MQKRMIVLEMGESYDDTNPVRIFDSLEKARTYMADVYPHWKARQDIGDIVVDSYRAPKDDSPVQEGRMRIGYLMSVPVE